MNALVSYSLVDYDECQCLVINPRLSKNQISSDFSLPSNSNRALLPSDLLD